KPRTWAATSLMSSARMRQGLHAQTGRLGAQVVEQEIAADAGIRDGLDAVEGVVGLDEGEHRVRQERHRGHAREAIEQVMRPARASEARPPWHVKRGAELRA